MWLGALALVCGGLGCKGIVVTASETTSGAGAADGVEGETGAGASAGGDSGGVATCKGEACCQGPCPGGACDANGVCKVRSGDACAQASDCASNECVEQVCRCVTQITAAEGMTCARKMDGSVWCWGTNESGEAGDGTTEARLTPVPVSGLGPAVLVVAGRGGHTCAVRADGGVSCWGFNSHGKLGNGSLDGTQPLPGAVPAFGTGVVAQLALGYHHTCARDSEDQVWCWGNNVGGLLGNGVYPGGASMPVPVESVVVAPMVQIAAGANDNCGVALDGTVWCWGLNEEVPIGDGTTEEAHPMPVQVLGLDQVVEISMGVWRTCARRDDGSVWCWGMQQPLAEAVPSLQDVAQLGVGLHFQCARKSDGTVWCWGENGFGQLGNPPFEGPTETPLQVSGLPSAAVEIAVGQYHACARLADDSVHCWGWLPSGVDGELSITPAPAQVPLSCP